MSPPEDVKAPVLVVAVVSLAPRNVDVKLPLLKARPKEPPPPSRSCRTVEFDVLVAVNAVASKLPDRLEQPELPVTRTPVVVPVSAHAPRTATVTNRCTICLVVRITSPPWIG